MKTKRHRVRDRLPDINACPAGQGTRPPINCAELARQRQHKLIARDRAAPTRKMQAHAIWKDTLVLLGGGGGGTKLWQRSARTLASKNLVPVSPSEVASGNDGCERARRPPACGTVAARGNTVTGSFFRLIDLCITQLEAHGPVSRVIQKEKKKKEEKKKKKKKKKTSMPQHPANLIFIGRLFDCRVL